MTTIAERVAAGAAWLDANRPGWVNRIDLETLDLEDSCNCVLGQEYEEYVLAPDDATYTALQARDYEFVGDARGFYDANSDMYPALTEEWRRYIETRRRTGGTADAFETPDEIAAYDRARDV